MYAYLSSYCAYPFLCMAYLAIKGKDMRNIIQQHGEKISRQITKLLNIKVSFEIFKSLPSFTSSLWLLLNKFKLRQKNATLVIEPINRVFLNSKNIRKLCKEWISQKQSFRQYLKNKLYYVIASCPLINMPTYSIVSANRFQISEINVNLFSVICCNISFS